MGIEKNQVDVARKIELIGSELTHPENNQLLRHTLRRKGLAITLNGSLITIIKGRLHTKVRQVREFCRGSEKVRPSSQVPKNDADHLAATQQP